jgi:hypothetical protein
MKLNDHLHIFLVNNPTNCILAYEYIHEKAIDKNLILIIQTRDLKLDLFNNFHVHYHKRGILNKIADRLLIKFISEGSIIKRKIESYKKDFILYTAWFDEITSKIVCSKKYKGHIYLEEGDQSYKNFPLFSNSEFYYRRTKLEVGEYNFTDYYREDALQWIGISYDSFPTAPAKKKYILKSFRHVKKKYIPFLNDYTDILLLPTPGRLPKNQWKNAIKKLAKNSEGPFAVKLHPGYGTSPSIYRYFDLILKDAGYSNFVICNPNVIIEAEMLFSKKLLIGDRSSLFRYANFLGSRIKKIDFIWKSPETIYLK